MATSSGSTNSTDAPKNPLVPDIQVLNITTESINGGWFYLKQALSECQYIAIDLELSGLGNLSQMRSKNIEERYRCLRETAMSRSILSVGIATFKIKCDGSADRRISFDSHVFNILTLCSQPFTTEPDALKFLAKHSFDFNKLISSGVPYSRSDVKGECRLRTLFLELLCLNRPLFFHNGLHDLVFLYHHFYSPLPEKWGEFCNALADIFTEDSPLVDSKYLAEFESRMSASFLEFVFRKCQGDNVRESLAERFHIIVEFPPISKRLSEFCETVECGLPPNFPDHPIPVDLKDAICAQFANHGFCRNEAKGQCHLIHDVDLILDAEWQKKEKQRLKKKRKYDHLKPDAVLKKEQEEMEKKRGDQMTIWEIARQKSRLSVEGCHRAGVDAFMTGFAVLFQERLSLYRTEHVDDSTINRLPLSGKSKPFVIQSTNFAGNCPKHEERFAGIKFHRQ